MHQGELLALQRSDVLLDGVAAKVISEMLGHASIAIILNTYSHVLPTMQRSAAAAMDRLFG